MGARSPKRTTVWTNEYGLAQELVWGLEGLQVHLEPLHEIAKGTGKLTKKARKKRTKVRTTRGMPALLGLIQRILENVDRPSGMM